jgi:Fur family ferric uptake transcriptional regulator
MDNCCEPNYSEVETKNLLKKYGLSATKNMLLVYKLLKTSKTPLSSSDLQSNIKSADNSTVFRILQKLKTLDLIIEIDLNEGFKRFELKPENHHHHHIICESCQNVEVINKCQIEILEKECKNLGYSNIKHKIEFFGICSNCI